MKVFRISIAIFPLLASLSAASAFDAPKYVSLVSLIGSPRQYASGMVIVSGYLCWSDTREAGLFLTRSDCDDANYSNAVAVDLSHLSKAIPRRPALLTVEGKFEDWSDKVLTDEAFSWGIIHASNISGRTLR